MHTEVCIGLDIAHFPSLMYGFIMQQIYIYIYNIICASVYSFCELTTVRHVASLQSRLNSVIEVPGENGSRAARNALSRMK